jgi:MFS family permease
MDAFIYALVMVPALRDLLPASGMKASAEPALLVAFIRVGIHEPEKWQNRPSVTQTAVREGYSAVDGARFASWATMLLAFGTILGCLVTPFLAETYGRRGALAAFFALMAASIVAAFGWAFYLPHGALVTFVTCLFFLGIGGASFCVYTLWLPEQYSTDHLDVPALQCRSLVTEARSVTNLRAD